MARKNLPKHRALWALFRDLRASIKDDDRADEEAEEPSMTVTVGWDPDGAWNYQTGDNSFTGGAYGYRYWAVVYLARNTRLREVARDVRDQLYELTW